jgi:alpha-tubulin suppressor-like RCC1 family protein
MLFGWGLNNEGQIGDSTRIVRMSPAQIGSDANWSKVACGSYHSIAIKNDGTLWAWGDNDEGQLGDGKISGQNRRDLLSPVQIGSDANWSKVACGTHHSTAIRSDGTLWAWGYNGAGQLGDGTFKERNSPIQIGSEKNWLNVFCVHSITFAIKSDGTLWAWGNNNQGLLCDGTKIHSRSPIQIGSETNWSQVNGSYGFIIALKSDGTRWVWGHNLYGNLGDGTKINHSSPVQISNETNWSQVSCGYDHCIALKGDGTLWAWGRNGGTLGDGTKIDRSSPVQIGSEKNWSQLSCGESHSIAIKSDGTLWSWGRNDKGQLGGDSTEIIRISPAQIGNDSNWSQVSCGLDFSIGLTTSINHVTDPRAEIFDFKTSPNPFFDEVNIEFYLPSSNKVSLQVYDISGAQVSTLFEGNLEAGLHKYMLEGTNLSSSVYTVILTVGNERIAREVIRVK